MSLKDKHPLYGAWRGMKNRCSNPNHSNWERYGGRGITVCARWLGGDTGFENFLADMGPQPKGHTIDRIDNNKGYSPENCRWATRSQQQTNQEQTRKAVIDGVEYIVSEVAKAHGFKTDTLVKRAETAKSFEEWICPEKRVYLPGLFLGGSVSGAKRRSMTHCKSGHEFTPDNTLTTKEGWRSCRTCHAARQRERTAKRKSASR